MLAFLESGQQYSHWQKKSTQLQVYILLQILTWPRALMLHLRAANPAVPSWPPGSNTTSPHKLHSY